MPELVYSDEELGLAPGWDSQDGVPLKPAIRSQLKQTALLAKKLEEAEATIAAQSRADAFRRAGIPDDKRGDAFAKVSTADPSNPEAVKAEFEELFGVPDPEAAQKAQELAEAQRIAAAGGTQTGTPGTVKFEDALRNPDLTPAQVVELIKNAPPETGLRMASDGNV